MGEEEGRREGKELEGGGGGEVGNRGDEVEEGEEGEGDDGRQVILFR